MPVSSDSPPQLPVVQYASSQTTEPIIASIVEGLAIDRPSSPVAPSYSPITPKAQPVLPVLSDSQNDYSQILGYEGSDKATASKATPIKQEKAVPATAPQQAAEPHHTPAAQPQQSPQSAPPPVSQIAPTKYIPAPPPLPFSSEDSTDAIALRAAISALQFQKRKAEEDVRALQTIKTQALTNPNLFKEQLISGGLREERSSLNDRHTFLDRLDQPEDEREDSDTRRQEQQNILPTIPGPQNIVRMPHINWDKYHISGEALDAMHDQQRRWPGSSMTAQDLGREHAIAAPYSPIYDGLNGNPARRTSGGDPSRRQSGDPVRPGAGPASATGTVSEHPMETRRGTRS